jgi:hypothetical protein
MHIFVDNTMLSVWLRCREELRLTYLKHMGSAYIPIHRELGIAVHSGIECLWRGGQFTDALALSTKYLAGISESIINSAEQKKWGELKAMVPTMLATYADTVDTDLDKVQRSISSKPSEPQLPLLEYQWQLGQPFGIPEVTLVGRIDRCEIGPILVDTKTATEMDGFDEMGKKVGWERSYRAAMVKDPGLGMYDFWLRQIGLTPQMVALEVILKPSERYGKKCRVVRLELPEVLAYRERFDMLLEFNLKELVHFVREYNQLQPWPMNGSACSGKYGNCIFLAACGSGINPRTQHLYSTKEEHLDLGGRKRIEL